eukprot:CAMPEP_0184656678 /NCGR_PEP_ID=MMETSP0308-20130426/16678_1 /TAXON_ID=38269 /ORGANISM="Gloeochaete witrockiana, Strain SAG 46.84" /LENGTH=32 /DNA_ID= /DNA_START= /DNA_END= /DNA_ORIENTATION=
MAHHTKQCAAEEQQGYKNAKGNKCAVRQNVSL